MSTTYHQRRTTMPALKEALWPISSSGIFTTSRALILYWLVWWITAFQKIQLPTTDHEAIDMALSMSSIKAFYLTICLVGTITCWSMILNLMYLFFLLGLSSSTSVFIRGYLHVVKPYHRGGGKHLQDAGIFSKAVPLRQWSRRQLESGYPKIDDLIAHVGKFMTSKGKWGAGRRG